MAIEASRGPVDANEQVLIVGMIRQNILVYCSCRGAGEDRAASCCPVHCFLFVARLLISLPLLMPCAPFGREQAG